MKKLLLIIPALLLLASPSWATISFGTAGAAANGTTSLSIAYPATVLAGDLLVMCVTNKYPTNGPTTPSGWTAPANGQASGGDGVSAQDDGNVYATIFTKLADGTETGNVSVTLTSANTSIGIITRYRNFTGAWTTAATNGSMNTPGTAWSVTGAADEGVLGGDYLFTCSGRSVDTVTFTVEALSQTGIVFGTMGERTDVGTTNGDDVGITVADFVVTSGTSSAAPVFTATASATVGGSTAFLRMRETASTPIVFHAVGAGGTGTGSATPAFPTVSANDLLLLCIANKYPAATPTLPTDAFGGTWALVTNGQQSGGTGADANNTGHALASLYYKVSPSGTETGNLTVTVSSGNSIYAGIASYTNTTGLWLLSATNGHYDTADANYSITGAADPGIQTSDYVVTCTATADDLAFSAETLTSTGITYGTLIERLDNGTTLGDDVANHMVDFIPIAGTSSAAPVYTATNAATVGGATIVLRLRQDTAAAAVMQNSQGFLGAIIK